MIAPARLQPGGQAPCIRRRPRGSWLLLLLLGLAPAAARADGEASPAPRPIDAPLRDLEQAEALTEAVANRLVDPAAAPWRGDDARAASYLTADFLGTGPSGLRAVATERLPLGVTRRRLAPPSASSPTLARAPFLAALRGWLGRFERLTHLQLKVKGAEFTKDGSRGALRLQLKAFGLRRGAEPLGVIGYARGEAVRSRGAWRLRRLLLDRSEETSRAAPFFTETSRAAGLAHTAPPFGHAQNRSFFWRGAAAADADGDGDLDLFTSSPARRFFYRNRGDGTFEDATASAGLRGPGQVTAPLFLDIDNDGDLDLLLAYGGHERDGAPEGEPLRFYENVGGGRFRDRTEAVGLLGVRIPAFGLAAADIDQDGFLDVYVASYQRYGEELPDRWDRATNGTPNLLLHNVAGKRFQSIAAAAGVAGRGWSYAASFCDFDEDGDPDLYVANDYGPNQLYVNQGDGTFRDEARARGVEDVGNGMAVFWDDLNGDGRLDLYVSNMASSAGSRILSRFARAGQSRVEDTLFKLAAGNSIFTQRADHTFQRLPAAKGGVAASWAWGAAPFDLDLDGRDDIYVANGFISGGSPKDT